MEFPSDDAKNDNKKRQRKVKEIRLHLINVSGRIVNVTSYLCIGITKDLDYLV
jgi:hypothetical protein